MKLQPKRKAPQYWEKQLTTYIWAYVHAKYLYQSQYLKQRFAKNTL